jgi:hypothetical protein
MGRPLWARRVAGGQRALRRLQRRGRTDERGRGAIVRLARDPGCGASSSMFG